MRAAGFSVSMLASAALLATGGCGGGAGSSSPGALGAGNVLPNPASIGAAAFQPGTGNIYVANQNGDSIDVFSLGASCGTKIGSITVGLNAPYGLWFDAKSQSLSVANSGNSTVTVYSTSSGTPTQTYSQDLNRPLYPILDQNGNLYVGNANDGTIVEYLAGSTTPSRVLQTPGIETDGLAFDQHGDLFAAYRTGDSPGQGSIVEFPAGSSTGTQLGMALTAPQGLVVDSKGNIVVAETEGVNRLDVFASGSSTASVQAVIPGGGVPVELALDSNDSHLYVSTLGGTSYGTAYPLTGPTFFVQESESATTQGLTISYNQSV